MLFKHALVAYDGSTQGKKALSQAISYVNETPDADLKIIHVMKFPYFVMGEAYIPTSSMMKNTLMEHAEKVIADAKEISAVLGERVALDVVEGYPGDCIIEYAKEHGCDLIIMGSRGNSGLKELVLGSVSHYVIQHSSVPVLVVK